MRFYTIFNLVQLYLLFFKRKVLSVGILKEKIFKYIISFLFILLIFIFTLLFYEFLDSINSDKAQMNFLIRTYSMTVFVWTCVCFLFLKVLFLKSSSFLKLTYQLPVTNNERNISLLVFELLISLLCIFTISFSFTTSIFLKYSCNYLFEIICNIFFVSITVHIILQLVYSILLYIINYLKIHIAKSVIVLGIFTLFLTYVYISYNTIIENIVLDYFGEIQYFNIILFFNYVLNQYGFLSSLLCFVLINILFIFIILHIPNDSYIEEKTYFKILNILDNSYKSFFVYLLSFFRRVENYNYIVMTYFSYIYFTIFDFNNSIYLLTIPSIIGLYSYVQTDSIRYVSVKLKYNVKSDYFNLILGQFIFIVLSTLPLSIIEMILSYSFISGIKNLIFAYSILFLSIITLTMIGILFPAEKENPFTPFIGMSIVFVIFLVLALSFLVLNLQNNTITIIIGLLYLYIIYCSIQGMLNTMKGARNENLKRYN